MSVFNELAAQIDLYDGCRLYHYRDRLNREIDFIIENNKGELLGIEVKVGTSFSSDDCRHMTWFKNNIVPGKPFTGIVIHSGMPFLHRAAERLAQIPEQFARVCSSHKT